MVWITAPERAEHQAPRIAQAIAESEHQATEVNDLSSEVRDAITAFRLQIHLMDRSPLTP